jgi:mono/diheme cytochrome c family protein
MVTIFKIKMMIKAMIRSNLFAQILILSGSCLLASSVSPLQAEATASDKTVVAASDSASSDGVGISPLVISGRDLYRSNGCNSCHGDSGLADTATGMALKARNFQADEYKNGASIEGIVKTLKEGLAGTAMAAYDHIPDDDKKAIAAFLLALKDNPDVAKVPKPKTKGGNGKISLAYAMELLAEPKRYPIDLNFTDDSHGAKLYAHNCSSCHGDQGQGLSTRFISAAPFYRVRTNPMLGHDGEWMESKAKFYKLIAEGLPGKLMPGMGTMTKEDMDAIYEFMKDCQSKAAQL